MSRADLTVLINTMDEQRIENVLALFADAELAISIAASFIALMLCSFQNAKQVMHKCMEGLARVCCG